MFEGNAKGPLFAANEQQELRATPQKCHVALLGNHGLPCGQDVGSKFLTCKAYKLALCCAFLNKSEVVTNTNPKVPRGTFGKKQTRRAPFSAIALAQPPRRQLNTLPCSRVCSPANRYEFRATRLLQDSRKCKHHHRIAIQIYCLAQSCEWALPPSNPRQQTVACSLQFAGLWSRCL